jgi:FkbM family methyltransferase
VITNRPGQCRDNVGAHVAYLQANLAANHIVHVNVLMEALAEREGSMRLYIPAPMAHRGYNATLLPRVDWQSLVVPTRRLDNCLPQWGVQRIDVMKIDVEGSEPRVLSGGSSHLAQGVVQHVMIEINGPRLVEGGSNPAALVRQLDTLGFSPARLARGRAVAVPVKSLDLDPTHESDQLFVHRSGLQ